MMPDNAGRSREPGTARDAADELKHFYVCETCGQAVDRRSRSDLSYHLRPGHEPVPSDA
jgi:hypothetical protein